MYGFSCGANRFATEPSCSPRRATGRSTSHFPRCSRNHSPRRSPPRFPTAAASARSRRSSRTRRPPCTPPHPRRTPSGRLAHPRVVLGAHHAFHLHGAATGAHEAQGGVQLVTGRVAVVGARPGVLPWVMTQVCASMPSGRRARARTGRQWPGRGPEAVARARKREGTRKRNGARRGPPFPCRRPSGTRVRPRSSRHRRVPPRPRSVAGRP